MRKFGRRFYSISSRAAKFEKFGNPQQVLKVEEYNVKPVGPKDVRIAMVAAPINPADYNIIEGRYGKLPELPAIAGGEGVGIVEEVGSDVKGLMKGQRVIPSVPASGTWQTQIVAPEDHWLPAPEDIDIEYAATIGVNPCTAFRLLHDFENLEEGDTVIQTGANSHVGLVVTQLARLRKLNIINIIRDRPGQEEMIEKLKVLGGDGAIVLPESIANTHHLKKILSDVPPPKLGLNNTGGKQLRVVSSAMKNGGTVVTYGGMSRNPVILPTSSLIFNNLTFKGFWYTKWVEQASREERLNMIRTLSELIEQNQLVWFLETYKFSSEFQQALVAHELPYKQRKIVFRLDK